MATRQLDWPTEGPVGGNGRICGSSKKTVHMMLAVICTINCFSVLLNEIQACYLCMCCDRLQCGLVLLQ